MSRSVAAVVQLWLRLRVPCTEVKCVSVDCSWAYIGARRYHLQRSPWEKPWEWGRLGGYQFHGTVCPTLSVGGARQTLLHDFGIAVVEGDGNELGESFG